MLPDTVGFPAARHRKVTIWARVQGASGLKVVADVPATIILACFINWMDRKGIYKKENQLLFYLVCSIVTGFLGCILVRVGIGVHLDKILIGCIMLTIPGIPITYAMRDMLLGESITGLFRFVESLLIAASIAGGFLLATVLAEGVL